MIEFTPGQIAGTAEKTEVHHLVFDVASENKSSEAISWAIVAAALLSAGVLLVIFGLTIAPDLTWANHSQDGGELITAAVTLGVPHPPGYPSYVLIGKLFSLLPFGTVAFRFNLLSAVSVAIAGGLMAALIRVRNGQASHSLAVAVAGGVTVGLLPIIWSQATIAEVYGLNLAFVAAFLFCLLAVRKPGLAGLFLGLALTSHLSSLILLPLALFLTPGKQYGRLASGLAVGLVPFLFVTAFSHTGSPVIWGAPQSIKGWWWLISGQLYDANLILPATTAKLGRSLARPSMWLSLVIIVTGILLPRFFPSSDSTGAKQEGVALGPTAALFALFALLYQTNDAFVLLIPALFILTYLAFTYLRPPWWIALLVPIFLLLTGFERQNLHEEHVVRPLAETVLGAAPRDAIIITPGDRSIFTLWYFQHVENQRTDLLLVDANLFAFDWYRERLLVENPQLQGLATDDINSFLKLNEVRSNCFTGLISESTNRARRNYVYLVGTEAEAPYLSCQDTTS